MIKINVSLPIFLSELFLSSESESSFFAGVTEISLSISDASGFLDLSPFFTVSTLISPEMEKSAEIKNFNIYPHLIQNIFLYKYKQSVQKNHNF